MRDRLAAAGPGRWQAEVELPAGCHEFMLASEDWRQADLGAGVLASSPAVRPGRSLALGTAGVNLAFDNTVAGRWRFTLDVRDPGQARLTVRELPR